MQGTEPTCSSEVTVCRVAVHCSRSVHSASLEHSRLRSSASRPSGRRPSGPLRRSARPTSWSSRVPRSRKTSAVRASVEACRSPRTYSSSRRSRFLPHVLSTGVMLSMVAKPTTSVPGTQVTRASGPPRTRPDTTRGRRTVSAVDPCHLSSRTLSGDPALATMRPTRIASAATQARAVAPVTDGRQSPENLADSDGSAAEAHPGPG